MKDSRAIVIAVSVSIIIVLILGIMKVWAKNELCSVYYADMNRFACFMSDSTLPQRTNR